MTKQEQRSGGNTENIVVAATDLALIGRYRDEPAPLLPILHAFHNRDGFIGTEAIEAIGKELRIPLADLYGTVTFYHHFARAEGGSAAAARLHRACLLPARRAVKLSKVWTEPRRCPVRAVAMTRFRC